MCCWGLNFAMVMKDSPSVRGKKNLQESSTLPIQDKKLFLPNILFLLFTVHPIFWFRFQGVRTPFVGIRFKEHNISHIGWMVLICLACGKGFLPVQCELCHDIEHAWWLSVTVSLVLRAVSGVLPVFLTSVTRETKQSGFRPCGPKGWAPLSSGS